MSKNKKCRDNCYKCNQHNKNKPQRDKNGHFVSKKQGQLVVQDKGKNEVQEINDSFWDVVSDFACKFADVVEKEVNAPIYTIADMDRMVENTKNITRKEVYEKVAKDIRTHGILSFVYGALAGGSAAVLAGLAIKYFWPAM